MSTSNAKYSMVEIDFLPESYREAGIQRKNITWRVLVVALFVLAIGGAAGYQQHMRQAIDQKLANVQPLYEQAKLQRQHLADTQQLLEVAEKQAELCTYLKHPWPRSQILSAIAETMPEEIELTEIDLTRETQGAEPNSPPPAAKPSDAAKSKTDPAQRDLTTLREQCDRTRIVVKIAGVSDDPLALHRYLEELGQCPLFTKVDVGTIEREANNNTGRIHFNARLTVQPGYGQPHGPTAPSATVNKPQVEAST